MAVDVEEGGGDSTDESSWEYESYTSEETVPSSSSSSSSEPEPTIKISFLQSALSLVPYTKYWWEAQRAYEAANNLRQMQEERRRAQQVLSLYDNGLYQDVLQEHAKDTELCDFAYFNRIKTSMAKTGEWTWQKPKRFIKTADLRGRELEKFQVVGILRKIQFDMCHSLQPEPALHSDDSTWTSIILSFKSMLDYNRKTSGRQPRSKAGQPLASELTKRGMRCAWTYRDAATGKRLICHNKRMEHPTRRVTDAFGAVMPDILKFCAYHTECCVGEHETLVHAVTTPNELALCNHCYVRATSKAPNSSLTKHSVPGVYLDFSHATETCYESDTVERDLDEVRATRELVARKALERRSMPLTQTTVCTWIPNNKFPRERGLVCTNFVIKHPENEGEYLPFCGWHARCCLHTHSPDNSAAAKPILIPNADGLCPSHYVHKHGQQPVDMGWPLPGMESIPERQHLPAVVQQAVTINPLAPRHGEDRRYCSFPLLQRRVYHKPEKTMLPLRWYRRITWRLKQRHWEKHAVTVQRYFRRHRARRDARRRRAVIQVRRRLRAATKAQAAIRCFLVRPKARREASTKIFALKSVQRLVRGYQLRKRNANLLASLRLQRACVSLYRRMIQSSTIEFQRRRRLRWLENKAARCLQRVMLGALVRCRFKKMRAEQHKRATMQTRIAAAWRRSSTLQAARRASERNALRVTSAVTLQLAWRIRSRHRELNIVVGRRERSQRTIQRVIRGAIGRRRAAFKRQRVAAAWRDIVGPTSPSRRALLEALLPKAKYKVHPDRRPTTETTAHLNEDSSSPQDTGWFEASDASFFEKYDVVGTGTLSRFDFRRAMRDLWRSKGLEISDVELELFTKMFDNFSDGNVNWHSFHNFSRLSHRPCSRHRRIVCGECVSRGPCQRIGCSCEAFVKAHALKDLVCVSCSHTPFAHLLVPLCCVETASPLVISDTIVDTFQNRHLRPDKPQLDSGTRIETVLEWTPEAPQGLQPAVVNDNRALSKKTTLAHKVRPDFDKAVEKLCVPRSHPVAKPKHGLPIAVREGQMPLAERSDLAVRVKSVFEPNDTIQESLAVAASEREVIHQTMFEGVRQSKAELQRGFGVTRPVPMVVHNELRWTVKIVELYVHLLSRLADDKLTEQEFGQLIFQNDAFFERHWKKLVRDVRSGKLNRHVSISADRRSAIESAMYPKPKQADMLDRTLKRLGFHARSEGNHLLFARNAAFLGKQTPLPVERQSDQSRPAAVKDDMASQPASPSLKPLLSRRRSSTDVNDKISQTGVHSGAYELKTLPRRIRGAICIQRRRTRPNVCPHPGCGESFSSRVVCEKHIAAQHAGRKRLAVATPEQDQYLSRYWPANGLPWQSNEKLIARIDDYSVIACPICGIALTTRSEMRRHLVVGHRKNELQACFNQMRGVDLPLLERRLSRAIRITARSSSSARVEFKGRKPLRSPPFPPPQRALLPICLWHERSSFRCPACAQARKLGCPKSPLEYGPSVAVTYRTMIDNEMTMCEHIFDVQSERAPLVVDADGHDRPAQLLSVCKDADGLIWIGVAYMWGYRDLRTINCSVQLPDDYDKNHELLEETCITYLRAERIVGHCYNLRCSREDFYHRYRCGSLPVHKNPACLKFARFVVDPCSGGVGPERVLNTDAPLKKITGGLPKQAPKAADTQRSTSASFRIDSKLW